LLVDRRRFLGEDHTRMVCQLHQLLGCAAVKPCQLATPPNPAWLAGAHNRPEVCQLVRVGVRRPPPRVARALVTRAVR
jgi:hypothetical protein